MKFLQKFMLPTGWFTDFDTMMICHLLAQWHWHFGYLFRQLLMSKILNLVLAANSIWVIPLEKDSWRTWIIVNVLSFHKWNWYWFTASGWLAGALFCTFSLLLSLLRLFASLVHGGTSGVSFASFKLKKSITACERLSPLFWPFVYINDVCSSPVPLVWPHPAPWTSSAPVVEWCDS